MSPTGTLYFIDGDRVRAISPSGIITTVAGNGRRGSSTGDGSALRESLNPSDVAVGADGAVYVANNAGILKLSQTGVLSIFAEGSPPYGDVSTPIGPSGIAITPSDVILPRLVQRQRLPGNGRFLRR